MITEFRWKLPGYYFDADGVKSAMAAAAVERLS
jgi:hypothetical protein